MNQCYRCKHGKEIDCYGNIKCIHSNLDKCKITIVRNRNFIIKVEGEKDKIESDACINEYWNWPFFFDPILIEKCNGFEDF